MNTKTYIQSFDPDSAAQAFWLASLPKDKLYVVVCKNQDRLGRLFEELVFFGATVFVFADWEILPYDRLSPTPEVVASRIALLSDMPTQGILLVALPTLMQRLAPPSWLLGQHFDLAVGMDFGREKQRERLIKAGYRLVDNVYEAGEFALRGSVVDLFVMGQALPFRLELFDDEIESIRLFNPENQRTFDDKALLQYTKDNHLPPMRTSLDSFVILPAKEFDLSQKEHFRQNFAKVFESVSHRKVDLYQDVMAGIAPSGIEFYQALFFNEKDWQTGDLFAYLPKDVCLIYEAGLDTAFDGFWGEVATRFEQYRHDSERPILPPALIYLPKEQFFAKMKSFAQMVLGEKGEAHIPERALPNLHIEPKLAQPLGRFVEFCRELPTKVLLVAESAGRRETLIELLKGQLDLVSVADFEAFLASAAKYHIGIAPLMRGLWCNEFCVISEALLFGRTTFGTRKQKTRTLPQEMLIKSVGELTHGSLVVHMEHGIGRYQGLCVMDAGGGEQEFIHLKYADDASIYVPIGHVGLIGRYGGSDSEAVALSKIGSGKWDKTRQKALTQIYDVAAELLNVQARRGAKEGIAFDIDVKAYELFASSFDFEETIDQKIAIDAIMQDMKSPKPMDRLICGDVGFGKTEVAMRAAFIAVQAGYQVAVLVPTTLLAGQHFDNFRTRFADWAVVIESLSRFGSKAHHDEVLAKLKDGKVDIVIGTHRLLQSDVAFKRLGLMIVDEEHRFGVRHKERIKAMQADVDCLSMTATPIPRTLNMALSGLQDICIIATPPARRLAIKTFVVEKNNQTTTDAILRELLRGGQVYYLHNDVASIDVAAEQILTLIPEARVGIAHGQMAEKELSAVMSDFYHKKTNVLVASTIIETGIDVPNANTIIINRADKFGLAQLHQLRGRVGRSHHQAYCYLFVPSFKGLSADAQKRLEAVCRANELGAGFMLASEDLQIRGAGELLGKEQSGHIQTIGFGLYMDMLSRAKKAIKEGKAPKLEHALEVVSDVNLHTSSLIPSDYLGDVSERLLFYKRIANCQTLDELGEIKSEMIDRFGAMPLALAHLFLAHKIRIVAHKLGVLKADVSSSHLTLEFSPDTPIDGLWIVKLLQSDSAYHMKGAMILQYRFKEEKTDPDERAQAAIELLAYFDRLLVQSRATN